MRSLVALGSALIVCAGLLSGSAAGASEFPRTKCYRNDEGQIIKCVSVKKFDGVRLLRAWHEPTMIFRHRVCVRKVEPVRRDRLCRTHPAQQMAGGFVGTKVVWREAYPFQGPGVYRVSWFDGDDGPLGGPLFFRAGPS